MLDAHLGRTIEVDLCEPCQSLWFDGKENLQLTPGATLAIFRAIGEHVRKPEPSDAQLVKCPHCKARLRRTQDMQRATRFEYFRCPNNHGRLTAFFDFLKEKDFIRPLTFFRRSPSCGRTCRSSIARIAADRSISPGPRRARIAALPCR